jgi:IS30 family transposase
MDDPATAAAVKDALRQDHSPELIDGRLALLDGAVRIGRQTIYNWITAERNKGRKWHRYLPRRGKPCRSRKSGTARYRGQKPIGERPAVVAQRRRLGDWEGDTLEGRKGGMAVLTLVERRSRRTMLCRLPDRSGEALHTAVAARFTAADDLPRRTLTVDQGREFADGEALAQSFGGAVYCTDPHSPWQKGTVEQTNGLLRRYLPKGFDGVSDRELTLAEDRLNHRPRKCLGFRTPHEVLFGISPA